MSLFTVKETADLAGVSIPTIYRRIKSGQLSRRADGKIDKAEILRCFGEIRLTDNQTLKETVISENQNESFLKQMIIDLKADIDKLKAESLEREKQALHREELAHEREKKLILLLDNKSDNHDKESITKSFFNLFK